MSLDHDDYANSFGMWSRVAGIWTLPDASRVLSR